MSTETFAWQDIEDEKEKYAAYLCSREWAEKREAVRERAKDKCERCLVMPMDACHHLTYIRKYDESLDDLQAICSQCHNYLHGHGEMDPAEDWRSKYHRACSDHGVMPLEDELIDRIIWLPMIMAGVGLAQLYMSLVDCEEAGAHKAVEYIASLIGYVSKYNKLFYSSCLYGIFCPHIDTETNKFSDICVDSSNGGSDG